MERIKEQVMEKEDKKVIVEIGCGLTPFPLSGKRKLKGNETYIGIEPNEKSAQNAKSALNDFKEITGAEKFEIFERLGEKTGLPENYADEIIIINVVGYRETILKFDATAKEAKRVLKKEGLVYIVETNTPYGNPLEIINIFQNNDFKLIDYIRLKDGEAAKKELIKYMLEKMLDVDSYMLLFQKK